MRLDRLCVVLLLGSGCGDDGVPVEDSGTTDASTGSSTTTSDAATTSSSEGSSESTSSGEEESSSSGEPPPPPLQWIDECNAHGVDLHVLHPDIECTSIEVPLDWNDPDGQQILVGALRVTSDVEPGAGQFWALDGGPGGSGLFFFLDTGFVDEVTQAGYDFVVPAHRGTLSPFLECPGHQPLSSTCREVLEQAWGDGLRHFNTRWAARDVGEMIARTQAELHEPTIVYGLSYGTYWAQFYAGEHPTQADAVILDSVVPTDGDLAQEEYLVQQRAEAMLQECVDDPVCGERVGFASGAEFSAAVIAAIDGGNCGAGDVGLWESTSWRYDFASLINTHRLRNYVPLVAALLERCDPELSLVARNGVNALLASTTSALRPADTMPIGKPLPSALGQLPADLFGSMPLQGVVIGNTMILPDADPETAAADARRHFASLGFADLEVAADAVYGDLPEVDFDRAFVAEVPLLLVNGRYDVQTVLDWAEQVAAQHKQPLLEFPDGQHGLALTGTGGKYPDGSSCARKIMLDFAANPQQRIDASCLDELPEFDPTLAREDLVPLSMSAFGTEDPWSLLPPPS